MTFFLSCNFWLIRQERRQLEHPRGRQRHSLISKTQTTPDAIFVTTYHIYNCDLCHFTWSKGYKQVSTVQSSGLSWAININEKNPKHFQQRQTYQIWEFILFEDMRCLEDSSTKGEIFFHGVFLLFVGFLGLVFGKAGWGRRVLIFLIYLFGFVSRLGGLGFFCIPRAQLSFPGAGSRYYVCIL